MTHKNPWDFEIQTDQIINKRKKTTSRRVDFAILADSKVVIKGSKEIYKYLDLAREHKKQWNMRVKIITVVIGVIRMFANGPGDLGLISGRVIPKTQKMVLDASLLNTQDYKVRIKGKVEQSRERSSAFLNTLV